MLRDCTKSLKGSRGFTLIEIMVSLLVLTVGFLGVIGLLYTTIDRNRFAGQITEATTLAQDKIEQLKALGYDVADSRYSSYGATGFSELVSATGDTGSGIYTRTTAVAGTNPRYGEFHVSVKWARAGTQHSVSLQTIMSQ